MQYLNKPIVISANPPENTNVLWAKGDISNRNNIKIEELRQFVNGDWEEVGNESSIEGMSLPIEDVIKILPIPFDDETNIVVLKVHCGVKNAGSDIGEPYVLDNYEANKYLGNLASWIEQSSLVSDTVNCVTATVLFFNGTYRYDIQLSDRNTHSYTHVEEENLKYYDETEAYAVLPMINTSDPFDKRSLSPTVTWENCPEEIKETNKATWKELNEFL